MSTPAQQSKRRHYCEGHYIIRNLMKILTMYSPTKTRTRAWSYKQKITENFQEIWPNFLFSGNSYRFSNFVPIKNFWQFFSGICSASCTKKSCQKFFWFTRKKLMVQNFLVFQKNATFSQKNFQTWEFMFIGLSPALSFWNGSHAITL